MGPQRYTVQSHSVPVSIDLRPYRAVDFSRYSPMWRLPTWIGGGMAGEAGPPWTAAFEAPGAYMVTVRASEPQPDTAQAFRVVSYLITVQ